MHAPDDVPDDLDLALRNHLDDGQIVEASVAMAAFLGFSKLRIALGLVPDGGMDVRVVETPDVPEDG